MKNILRNSKKGSIVIAGLVGVAMGGALYFCQSSIQAILGRSVKTISSPKYERIESSPITVLPSSTPLTTPRPSVVAVSTPETSSQPVATTSKVASVVTAPGNSVFLSLINSSRKTAGLSEVHYNGLLNSAANAKCQDMVNQNYFSHTNPQGKNDFSFVTASGYKYQNIGSNIAKGLQSDQTVFDGWMASPEHRENILQSWGREIGYARINSYACMFITKPR